MKDYLHLFMCTAIMKRSGVETGEIACKLYKSFIHNCQKKIKAIMNEGNLAFEDVDVFSYHIRKM